MIDIRVRSSQASHSFSFDENSATFRELKAEVGRKFGLTETDFELLNGFPPTVLKAQENDLVSTIIKNQDTLRLQSKTIPQPTNSEALEPKESKGSRKGNETTTKSKVTKTTDSSSKSNIHTLTKANSSSGSKAKPSKSASSVDNSSNRPIAFGARVATLNSSNTPRPKPTRPRTIRGTKNSGASNEQDISEHLLSAVSGGGQSRDKVLRTVFRTALEHQYNSTIAISRLNAVYAHKYELSVVAGGRQLVAQFSQTASRQRARHEETVDLLDKPLLLELLKLPVLHATGDNIDEREVLKPVNLAKCSPRIFWSLVFHHYHNTSNSTSGSNSSDSSTSSNSSLVGVIKALLLGCNAGIEEQQLRFLDERRRELSEKARDNLQQQQRAAEARKSARRTKKGAGAIEDNAINNNSADTDSSSKGKRKLADMLRSDAARDSASASASDTDGNSDGDSPSSLTLRALCAMSAEEIVPVELHAEIRRRFLGDSDGGDGDGDSAAMGHSAVMGDRDGPAVLTVAEVAAIDLSTASSSSSSRERVTLDMLECFTDNARQLLFSLVRRLAVGGGCELLRETLGRLRVRSLRELLHWRRAARGIFDGVCQLCPSLADLPIVRHMTGTDAGRVLQRGPLSVAAMENMLSLADQASARLPWLADYLDLVDDDDDDQDDAHDDDNDLDTELWGDDLWVFARSASQPADGSERIGRLVEVAVRGQTETVTETVTETQGGASDSALDASDDRYFSPAVIVAHLPATADEPDALYRALLLSHDTLSVLLASLGDAGHGDSLQDRLVSAQGFESLVRQHSGRRSFRYEDLEEAELRDLL